ncbi:MAG: glycosyltransferase family 4 protein [Verrucomicrobiae bacterium]|nr:glycosyltransferase family 4 protein [Verrucomicrobiae bacterium]
MLSKKQSDGNYNPSGDCLVRTGPQKRIGFISTRFHGTDGVTLEARKWEQIFSGMGHRIFWMGGLLDTPPETSHYAPLAFFNHPRVLEVQNKLFGTVKRTREITNEIHAIKEALKDEIYRFIDKFHVEILIPENALAIPMHIPFGLAIAEVIAETALPTIAHHHDFYWERDRFTLNSVNDYLHAAFPPDMHSIEHVVINSMAQKELARRLGIPSAIIPNVLEFETPPPGVDDFNRDFRQEIGLKPDDILILQPTRVVARKGIEHAIDLVRRLKEPRAKLVISHSINDEGNQYFQMIRDRIEDAKIDVRFIADRIGQTRGYTGDGKKIYTLFDVYPHADLVTYPSYYEGFGNAFLEAIYFKKPIVVNTYAVYARDIDPLGFKTIEISNLITGEVVEQVRTILRDKNTQNEWAETNYQLGLKYFSYSVARRKLAARIANLFGEGLS